MALFDLYPELFTGLLNALFDKDQMGRGQVVKQGDTLLKKEGQVVVNTGRGEPLADISVNGTLLRVSLKMGTPRLTKVTYPLLTHREFTRRKQVDRLYLLCSTLTLWVKQTQTLDLIIKQVNTVRGLSAHGKEVYNGPTEGVLSMLHHL